MEKVDSAYDLPRSIFGHNFITPEEAAEVHGFVHGRELLEYLADAINAPGFKEILEWLQACGFVLVSGPPEGKSLLEVRAMDPDLFCASPHNKWWESGDEKFSRSNKVEIGLLALRWRWDPIPYPALKTWGDEFLPPEMRYLNVTEITYGMMTYEKARNAYLYYDVWVTSSSVDSRGDKPKVRRFDDGFVISTDWPPGTVLYPKGCHLLGK